MIDLRPIDFLGDPPKPLSDFCMMRLGGMAADLPHSLNDMRAEGG